MGRNKGPLYFDKKWKVFYARWYEGKKRLLFSLGIGDRIEANRRLPGKFPFNVVDHNVYF
jgi:hypothetical protein